MDLTNCKITIYQGNPPAIKVIQADGEVQPLKTQRNEENLMGVNIETKYLPTHRIFLEPVQGYSPKLGDVVTVTGSTGGQYDGSYIAKDIPPQWSGFGLDYVELRAWRQWDFTALLYHAVTVSRPGAMGMDDYGQPQTPRWVTLATYQGRFIPFDGGVVIGGKEDREKKILLDYYQLILPAGTDITASDRVDQVLDGNGVSVDSGIKYYSIMDVVRPVSHVMVTLRAIR